MANIKEIMESGTLELYVMGALSAEETAQIDALRKEHAELNSEILRIEDAMIAYADTHAVKPAPELKEKIAEKLNFSISLNMESEMVDSILIQMPGIYKLAAAAAVALIIALSGTTLYFGYNYRGAQNELQSLRTENSQIAGQVKVLSGTSEKMKGELAVALQPEFRKIWLLGQTLSPKSKAVVYWNETSGVTYVIPSELPAAPTEKQYQLWALVNHAPVSLGVIAKDSEFVAMQPVKNAQAFCITLEPMGGSVSPTRDQMYVMTNI